MLIQRPGCPACGGKARWSRSVGNLTRTLAALCVALVLGDLLAVRWRCRRCGRSFAALSDQ